MNVRDLKATIKEEKINDASDIFIRVSIQQPDGTWKVETLPVETYYTKGGFQLGCCLWNPDCEDDE